MNTALSTLFLLLCAMALFAYGARDLFRIGWAIFATAREEPDQSAPPSITRSDRQLLIGLLLVLVRAGFCGLSCALGITAGAYALGALL